VLWLRMSSANLLSTFTPSWHG